MSEHGTVEAGLLSEGALEDLLRLARETVRASVTGERVPPLPDRPELAAPRGVFVSLHHRGALRGCLGHMEADLPAAEATRRMAIAASRDDPRFPPVAPEELDELDVEVSVLTPTHPVRPDDVVPGRDGLVVHRGPRFGVLLPQVAAEHHWDRLTFLGAVCQKAGLPANAWRDRGTELLAFSAQVVPAKNPS